MALTVSPKSAGLLLIVQLMQVEKGLEMKAVARELGVACVMTALRLGM
jgi:hypothetical protein